MKNLFKKRFGLTDMGANNLVKASISSVMVYLINMVPALLLIYFINELLFTQSKRPSFFIIFSITMLIALYITLRFEYNTMYNATYKESANIRLDIASTLKELPLSYFSKHNLSDIAQTIMTDVGALERALGHAISKFIGFCIFFPLISALLILGNWKLGLSVVGPIVIGFLLIIISKKIQLKACEKYYLKLRDNSEAFQEAIELHQEINSFGLTEKIKSDLNKKIDESEKIHLKTQISEVVPYVMAKTIMEFSFALVLVVGSILLINNKINLLYLLGYILAAIKLKDGVDSITQNLTEIYSIDPVVNHIKGIREAKRQTGKDKEFSSFDIELKNVAFSYDSDTQILNNVTFTAKQNEITALVGLSGCGKTSILRLISRLYDYDKGSIIIDGVDIKDISTASLFDKVSIVFQDVTLFGTSIMENIRYGNKLASDEEIIKAAKLACCDDFVKKLPQLYQTVIGENGVTLSGGERQRLSIARAFVKNAPIIILDEIASSLDVENEKKIQESLNRLTKGRTVIIISHRLKSIEKVDKIVVINDKKVEAFGKHEELLEKSKTYKALVDNAKLAENFKY